MVIRAKAVRLTMNSSMMVAAMSIYSVAFVAFTLGLIRASRSIHTRLAKSILGTTYRWLDTTPSGRVISRFTQDLRVVDGPIVGCIHNFVGKYVSIYFGTVS